MNKYILINQNDIISTAENLEQAQALATDIATESGKNITIAQIKCIAKHTIVFSSLDESEEVKQEDESDKREKAPAAKKRYNKTPIGAVIENNQNTPEIEKEEVLEETIVKPETKTAFDFTSFLNEFKTALNKTSSILEHSNVSQDYKDSIELLTNEQKHLISDIKKSNIVRVGIKDISIELGSVKTEKDLNNILKRYPDNIKEDESVKKLVDSLLDEFKKESEIQLDETKQPGMDEEVFNKLLNDYETKLKSVDGFMDFDAVVQDFDSIFTDLTNEQSATVKAVQSLNYERIDNSLKALLSKDKDKKLETIQELKAIETDDLPPVFDEKEFKEKCKEAFSNAHTKARLEEFRDHLLEENKDLDKVTKPIIFQTFYERLANLQTAKPKYVGAVS